MTAHAIRTKRPAKGHKPAVKGPRPAMVRIMASFSPVDFARLEALANKRKVPTAKVIRDVVVAWLRDAKGAD